MIHKVKRWFKRKTNYFKNVKPFLDDIKKKGTELKLVVETKLSSFVDNNVVLVSLYRGYGELKHFIEYHQQRGVGKIVLLDVSGKESVADIVSNINGICLYRPVFGNIKNEKDYNKMLNFLRFKYAVGKWCLSLESCEYFRYPYDDESVIQELVEFLKSEHRRMMHAIAVIMYPNPTISIKDFSPKISFDTDKQKSPCFDGYGYRVNYNSTINQIQVSGGFLSRLGIESEYPEYKILNRIPLVFWSKNDAYISGTDRLLNSSLNHPCFEYHQTPIGCIEIYHNDILEQIPENLIYSKTGSIQRYSWRELCSYGLIQTGQWF